MSGGHTSAAQMLTKLTSAMSEKRKMIDSLASKQQHARRVTQQYDEQINYLQSAISDMLAQRNQELAKLGILFISGALCVQLHRVDRVLNVGRLASIWSCDK